MRYLTRVTDLSETEWIRSGVIPLTQSVSSNPIGNSISTCIPPHFEACCKIFHNIYEDVTIEDRTVTWDEVRRREPTDKSDPVHELIAAATTVYGGIPRVEYEKLVRIRWSVLAERYGLVFHPDLNVWTFTRNFPGGSWPRYLIGPEEGTLEFETCKELVRSLAVATCDEQLLQPCFFLYDLIATSDYEADELFSGTLRSVFETYGLEDRGYSPTYWWPFDRTWLVCTDWDLTFTLVGGSNQLIQSIISNPALESVRVSVRNRVDYQSDLLNP